MLHSVDNDVSVLYFSSVLCCVNFNCSTIPEQVFSEEAEKRLVELWADNPRMKAATMIKRLVKGCKIARKLSSFEKEMFDH